MTDRVRVLHIVTRLVVRGVPWHVLELADRLDRSRYEVEVLAGTGAPDEGSLWEEFTRRGLRTHHVPHLRRNPRPWSDLRAYRSIRRKIEQGAYDVVHTHISKAGVLGRLAAHRVGGAAVVHTYHGPVAELRQSLLGRRVLLPLERRAARMSDALIAVSDATAGYLEELDIGTPEQRVVIRYGVDVGAGSAPTPIPVEGGPVMGAVGSLTAEKGLDVLLQAAAGLSPTWPDLRVILVDGPLRGDLERMAADLGLGGRVRFAGHVADVRPWLQSFDLLVLPSRSEGFPRALLEGMAAGVAVVATDVGGVREALTDGVEGRLVPPDNPESLRQALQGLLADPAQRAAMGRRGRDTVAERFSMADAVARTAAVYEACIDKAAQRHPGHGERATT